MSAVLTVMPSVPLPRPGWPAVPRASARVRELKPQALTALRGGHLFSALTPGVQQAVLDAGRISRVSAGAVLARRDEPPRQCVGVISGAVRVSTVMPDARPLTLDILAPGQWFGDIALIDGLPQDVDMVAQMPSQLLLLGAWELRRLAVEHRELRDALLRLNCDRLRHLHRRFADLHALSLQRRVAGQLLRLSKRFGREQDGQLLLDLHLSQGDLAALTGGSRQRVNHVLGRMQSEGLLQVGPARLTIRDADGLRALAEGRRPLAT